MATITNESNTNWKTIEGHPIELAAAIAGTVGATLPDMGEGEDDKVYLNIYDASGALLFAMDTTAAFDGYTFKVNLKDQESV